LVPSDLIAPGASPHVERFDGQLATENKATMTCQQLLLAETDGKRTAPEWIPLLPAGDVVLARDGRSFRNDHVAVMAAFAANKMELPVDWDHALDSWLVSPGDGRAAAWVDQLEVREGALWGHVSVWTERGRASVESLEYRYISPVIFFDDNRKLVMVPRASLVNNPALMMPALCRQENTTMNEALLKLLFAQLGLSATSTETDIKAVIDTFRGKTTTALDDLAFMDKLAVGLGLKVGATRSEILEALAETTKRNAELLAEAASTRINAMLDQASTSGRMLPHERDFFAGQAAKDPAVVEAFLSKRPVLVGPTPTPVDPSKPLANVDNNFGLSPQELEVCRTGGVSPEDFAKQKAARNNR
jgi:phage I-like protein